MDALDCRGWSRCRACWHHDDATGCTLLGAIEVASNQRTHPVPRRRPRMEPLAV